MIKKITQSISGFLKSSAFINRFSFLLVFLAISFGIATYASLTASGPFTDVSPDMIYILLNIDAIIFLLLIVVITRRIFILWRQRKEKSAATKIQFRLIKIFAILSITPSIILAIFSLSFFYMAMQTWFSDRVSIAINESLAVAEAYLEEHQKVIQADILAMANDLNRDSFSLIGNPSRLKSVVEKQSFIRGLSEAMVFEEDGRVLAKSGLTFSLEFGSISIENLIRAKNGDIVLMTSENDDRIRALIYLQDFDDSYLFVGRMVDSDVLEHIESTQTAVRDYTALEIRKSDFQLSFAVIFIFVSIVVVLASILFGLILARKIAEPIMQLIKATERVRGGDFDVRISNKHKSNKNDSDADEIDLLISAFNKMTREIKTHQSDIIEANKQLENRRHFIEAVFASVKTTILGLNMGRFVTLANPSSENLFGIKRTELIGQALVDISPELNAVLDRGIEGNSLLYQETLEILMNGEDRSLLVRIAFEHKDQDQLAVMTLDDVSALVSAQRKAAWSGVARRIAHEIKNPLTPIRLSAERLQRKYLKDIENDPKTFEECTDTIIRQVDTIGRMVSEFSEFARMPEPSLKKDNLNKTVESIIGLIKQTYPKIKFEFKTIKKADEVVFDKDLIGQAVQNVVKNAAESLIDNGVKDAQINIRIKFEKKQYFKIYVEDNGVGFDPNYINKVTEPYVTTKEKGTGLGLAITKKIMEDHRGDLSLNNRISNNCVVGATVVLSLPQ